MLSRPNLIDQSELASIDQAASGSSGGGAKHRMVDPPTTWPSAADPDAASTIHLGGDPGLDPTTMPIGAYDCEYNSEATVFGKEFLRMAGIVQMLHAPTPSRDKYPYANREGIRAEPGARDQTRS